MTPIDVTPRQLSAALATTMRADIPVMIWGDGGIGKSRIIEQAAVAAGRVYTDFRAMIKDLPDLQGYPVLSGMRSGESCPMTAPTGLPPSGDTRPHLLVLEELTSAPRMILGALYGLILERRLNEYRLPADCRIIATGNMATSGGITNAMPKPLASRFLHLRLIVDPTDSLAHATRSGWHPFVLAYHAWTSGTNWFQFDVKSTEETYACPRSWESVSTLLHGGCIPVDLMAPLFSGLLGYGQGQKFAAFVGLHAALAPTIAGMRTDPSVPLPTDAAAMWFVAASIAATMTPADAQWSLPLLSRLPDELAVFAINAAYHRDPNIAKTPEFLVVAKNPRYAALAVYC